MLNRLKIVNFKAWREADLRFGKVTGFFGTNSTGKSSLLQLLLLLKQTRNATDRGLGSWTLAGRRPWRTWGRSRMWFTDTTSRDA